MVESIIKGLKGVAELQGPLQASIWDQGDAVGAWIGDRLVAVVFPTPETLPKVRYTSASASLQYCVLLSCVMPAITAFNSLHVIAVICANFDRPFRNRQILEC